MSENQNFLGKFCATFTHARTHAYAHAAVIECIKKREICVRAYCFWNRDSHVMQNGPPSGNHTIKGVKFGCQERVGKNLRHVAPQEMYSLALCKSYFICWRKYRYRNFSLSLSLSLCFQHRLRLCFQEKHQTVSVTLFVRILFLINQGHVSDLSEILFIYLLN